MLRDQKGSPLDEQKTEVQRVLQSPQFRRAPKLQRLLEVICDYYFQSRQQEITEFLIATEAFGKGRGFDPGQDSLVRVQAREARRRLHEYYQGEGKNSRITLDIPLGSYVPTFTVADDSAPHGRRPSTKTAWGMLAVTGIACVAILLFADFERRQLTRAPSSASAKETLAPNPLLSRFWDRFTNSDVPTILVLSNPDTGDCTDPSAPCPNEYTGMGEAVALHLISNVFKSAKQTLLVKQSRIVTEDDASRHNLILLGGRKVNAWTQRLAGDLSLNAAATELSSAQPHPERFETVFDRRTGRLVTDRAVIALRRQSTNGHWVLVLYGEHSAGTQAAAEASTDERFLARLRWPPTVAPFPERFRVLVTAAVNNGIPQAPAPAAVRVP